MKPFWPKRRSLPHGRTCPAKRWQSIKARCQNEKFRERFKTFTGWTAQIIQHEADHCEGIII